MELLNRLIVRVTLGTGLGVASLVARPLAGTSHWTREIYRGELILLSVATLGMAIGQAAMAKVTRGWGVVLRTLVIAPGLVMLVVTASGVPASRVKLVMFPFGS